MNVLEVKALSGEFRCEGQEWLWRPNQGSDWQEAIVNPGKQGLDNARRIRETLRLDGLGHVRVRPAVAVASPNMHVELVPPLAVYIFFAHRRNASIETMLGYAQEARSGLSFSELQRAYTALLTQRQPV